MQVRESQAPSPIGDSHFVHVLNIYYRKDSSILPYICWSGLFTVLSFGGLFFYENFFHIDSKILQRQLIDIEFVSNADFQDKHELLPSTVPKPSVSKTASPVMQSKGELFAPPVFVIRQANNKPAQSQENQIERSESKQKEASNQKNQMYASDNSYETMARKPATVNHTELASRYLPLSVPFPVIPNKHLRSSLSDKRMDKPETNVELDEVSPPELMEIKENDGDISNNIWQDGGHSNHGLGAASAIAEYLKDLHRKIKAPLGSTICFSTPYTD